MSFSLTTRADGAHCELRNLVIEINKAFNDHPPLIHARATGCIIPRGLYFTGIVYLGLAFTRR